MNFKVSEPEFEWAKNRLKAFLIEAYSGQFILHCSQGRISKIDEIDSLRFNRAELVRSAILRFLDAVDENDITLAKKPDGLFVGRKTRSLKYDGR